MVAGQARSVHSYRLLGCTSHFHRPALHLVHLLDDKASNLNRTTRTIHPPLAQSHQYGPSNQQLPLLNVIIRIESYHCRLAANGGEKRITSTAY